MRERFEKNIINNLKMYGQVGVGIYQRRYPDNPSLTTKGVFTFWLFEIRKQYYNEKEGGWRLGEILEYKLELIGEEDELEIFSLLYKRFDTEEEVIKFLREFLNPFDNYRDLYSYMVEKAGFRKVERNLQAYGMVKDLLPDGESFEDFNERLGGV